MDQVTLVNRQLEDGLRLADRLSQSGFTVTAAGWIKASEDGQWFLYLASPFVDEEGALRAYRHVLPLIRQMPQPSAIDPFEIKLIGAANPLAQEMAAIGARYPGKSPFWFRGDRLGNLTVEGAYIYPVPISSELKNHSE